jgi:hypothetical protein
MQLKRPFGYVVTHHLEVAYQVVGFASLQRLELANE